MNPKRSTRFLFEPHAVSCSVFFISVFRHTCFKKVVFFVYLILTLRNVNNLNILKCRRFVLVDVGQRKYETVNSKKRNQTTLVWLINWIPFVRLQFCFGGWSLDGAVGRVGLRQLFSLVLTTNYQVYY